MSSAATPPTNGEGPAAGDPTPDEVQQDLAAVARVILGVDADAPVEAGATDSAEERRERQRRQQQMLDELSFLDD